jgi:TonB-linked SusC/RagA family outer membrane protein
MGRIARSVLAIVAALVAVPALAAAQEGATISGRVTSEAGAPLLSASVFLEGMNIGTLTKEDGRYTFVVPSARVKGQQVTVTARLIGFKAKSATIALAAGTITQDFVLGANPLRLGEVIVTGSGTSSTREKLGAVVNVVDSSALTRSATNNVVNGLAATAPNVSVTSQSGEPGASAYINIRGIRSLGGTSQPLFVVDGVPIDNSTISTNGATTSTVAENRASDINENDIESVTILKGAAAAAIYGAQGADGVVLITTKSGKSGATRFSLNSVLGVDNVVHAPNSSGYPLQTDYHQGSGGANQGLGYGSCLSVGCHPTSGSWGALETTGTPIYDQYGDLFHTGTAWDNNLSLSGGNDRTTFFGSLGYLSQVGTIVGPNNWYDKTTARVKASQRLGDRVNVSGNITYVDARGSFIQKGSNVSGLLLGGLRTPPEYNDAIFLDSSVASGGTGLHQAYRYPRPTAASARSGRGYDNPFFVLNEDPANGSVNRAIGNLQIDWEINDWLAFKNNLGADSYNDERLEALALTSSTLPQGQVIQGNITNTIVDNVATLVGSHTFNPNFSGTLTIGSDVQSNKYSQNLTTGQTLTAALPYNLGNAQSWIPNSFQDNVHSLSGFAQATADLFNQLYLSASIRRDGFSTFGAANPYAWYPRGSVAWTFTNALGNTEQKGILSFGKVRAAYGVTGKQPPVYGSQTFLNGGGVPAFGSGYGDLFQATQNGFGALFTQSLLGNTAIQPEQEAETELGFDFGFFNQKVDASVTWYQSYDTKIIQALAVPGSTGYSTTLSNAARLLNTGWEVSASWRAITTPKFSAQFGLNWGQNVETALYLGGATFVDNAGGTFSGAVAGTWLGTGLIMHGNDFARCGNGAFVGNDSIDANECAGKPHGALYIDVNGFPVNDPAERIIANPNPAWRGGLNGTLRFDKLQLTFLVDHKQGGQIWNGTQGALYFFGKHKDTDIRGSQVIFGETYLPGPTPVGPGAGMSVTIDQSWFQGLGSGFTGPSAQNVVDGTYTKIREVGLQYTLDQAFVTKSLGLSSIDLRVAATNIYTWTNYTGIDPDMNLGGAQVAFQGVDYFNNPATKSCII